MSDSSSESDSQRIGNYSTPHHGVKTLYCSLSSISDREPNRKYTPNNQDEGLDSAGISGDTVREHALIPPNIQSCGMERLFHRTDDLMFPKCAHGPCSPPDLPTQSEVLQKCSLLDNDSFDGNVGKHYRTYARVPLREKRDSPKEMQVSVYSIADLLWTAYMKDCAPSSLKQNGKPIQSFRTGRMPKFFKTRGQELKQDREVDEASGKQEEAKTLYCGHSRLCMLSLKRPLGWMAIKGICFAERLAICDGPAGLLDDSSESYQPLAKKRRSNGSIEYPSPSTRT